MAEKTKEHKFRTASFHCREEYVEMLKDYAYSERLTIKDVLDMALTEFFKTHKPRLHRES